jgi:hypothetical protein
MRQTWEEIGIDLAEKDYECIGQLDDREITTSLGKRLLMILSPFGEFFHFHWVLLEMFTDNLTSVLTTHSTCTSA